MLGAQSADGVTDQQLADFQLYADCIGLAFQIQDDILDVTAGGILGQAPRIRSTQ